MERNSGVFWAMLQCSLLIGNTYVYFAFDGKDTIDTATRQTVSTKTKKEGIQLNYLSIYKKYEVLTPPPVFIGSFGSIGYLCSWSIDIFVTKTNTLGSFFRCCGIK